MKKIKIYSILFFACLFVMSCEDQINLTPAQSLNTDEALADLDGLETAINGAYNSLQSVGYYGREFYVLPEIEGNLAYLTLANSNRFISAYTYTWTVQNGDIADVWNIAYRTILRANNVLDKIDALEGDATRKDQIKGEALAMRALCHFDLVKFFAKPYATGNPSSDLGVPIATTSTLEELPRNSVKEVYDQVIADFNAAGALLTGTDKNRFSADAVDALLARVYLYQNDYANAESQASKLIAKYSLGSDFNEMFSSATSGEDIFTLQFLSTETNGSDNHGGIYNPEGYGDIRATQDLIDLYEAGDQRNLVYQHTDGEYYTSKYDEQDGVQGLVSPKIVRLGEMYLIRAEARYRTNNDAGSLEDINTLRAARGASAWTAIGSFRDIIEERQRELVFEGHTTHDLWRNGLTMNRSQCNTGLEVTVQSCSILASDHRTVHPIPQDEILVNQMMVQNDGY